MRTVAWIMVLVGTPIAVGAFYFAIKPIAAMYQQAAVDPMSDAMPSDGKGVAKEMLVPAAACARDSSIGWGVNRDLDRLGLLRSDPMGRLSTISAAQGDAAYAAAQVVVETHRRIAAFLKAGLTLAQIDQFVAQQLAEQGAKSCFLGYTPSRRTLPPFPSHACLSVNECVVHGTAGYLRRPLQQGDVLKIDIGVHYRGWIGDAGWTYVFGKPSELVQRLVKAGKESLAAGCAQLGPTNKFRDFATAVQGIVEKKYGFHLIRGMGGHGLFNNGKPSLHGPPFVANRLPGPNESWEEQNWTCEVGTLVAVEPMIAVGTGVLLDKGNAPMDQRWPEIVSDGSLSVHYEHDVLVTPQGPRILTEGMEQLPDVIG